MFQFRQLHVYRAALEVLPLLHAAGERADIDIRRQLRRAAVAIAVHIGEGSPQAYRLARSSALEAAALLDVMRVLGAVTADELAPIDAMLERVVVMVTSAFEP